MQKLITPPQQKEFGLMIGSTCYVAKAITIAAAIVIFKRTVKADFDEQEVYQKS